MFGKKIDLSWAFVISVTLNGIEIASEGKIPPDFSFIL